MDFCQYYRGKEGICRIWNISIIAVIFLSIYNILLTLKLMYSPECVKVKHTFIKPSIKPQKHSVPKCDIYKTTPVGNDHPLHALDLTLGRWDTKLNYKLFDNIIIGDNYSTLNELYATCMATQSSLERMSSLIEVANYWNGPISIATFAAGDDEFNYLMLYILYLRQCNSNIREQVNFHLVFPKNHRPKNIRIDFEMLNNLECQNPIAVLQQILKYFTRITGKWRSKLPYPQNLLRNLARKNCQSKYVFLTDVDIIPSKDMAEKLNTFFEKTTCKGLCAFVVPTYEVDDRIKFPHNKTELVRLANKKLARPFHQKVFVYNQYATNFTRWESSVNEGQEVHVSHNVTNFEFLYEPFYIAPDTVPPHDERFVGYGYTRNSQVYEMFVAGYNFYVLSPIFTCHWGLQVRKTRPPWREHQNNLNRKQFDAFKREIFAKYKKDPLKMMAS